MKVRWVDEICSFDDSEITAEKNLKKKIRVELWREVESCRVECRPHYILLSLQLVNYFARLILSARYWLVVSMKYFQRLESRSKILDYTVQGRDEPLRTP
jgi:hypothetical protein